MEYLLQLMQMRNGKSYLLLLRPIPLKKNAKKPNDPTWTLSLQGSQRSNKSTAFYEQGARLLREY